MQDSAAGAAAPAAPNVRAVSARWWERWRAFASGSGAPWPGPLPRSDDPQDQVFVPSSIYDKLVEMNGLESLDVTAVEAVALYPSHWKGLNWSRAKKDPCACCGMLPARFQCSLSYCSEACHKSHLEFHKCDVSDLAASSLSTNASSPTRLVPVGLNNLGNTCFISATVQCLFHAKPFSRYFLRGAHLVDLGGREGNFSQVWAALTMALKFSQEKSISPLGLKRLAASKAQFSGFEQQDAHEFFSFVLESLHSELDLVRPPKPTSNWSSDPDSLQEAWIRERLRERSIINQLFYGMKTYVSICRQCKHKSFKHDEFRELILPFNTKDRVITLVFARQMLVTHPDLAHGMLNRSYALKAPPSATVLDLKNLLSKLSKVPPERMWMCIVFKHVIQRELDDNQPITEISSMDQVLVYELVHGYSRHLLLHHSQNGRFCGLPCLVGIASDEEPGREICIRAWARMRPCSAVRPPMAQVPRDIVLPIFLPAFDHIALGTLDSIVDLQSTMPANPAGNDPLGRFVSGVVYWDDFHRADMDISLSYKWYEHKSVYEPKEEGGESVRHLLQNYCAPELMEDKKCEKCNGVGATRTVTLHKLPEILVLQLNRFATNQYGSFSEKITTHVDFDVDGATFNEFTGNLDDTYDLFGVCNHYGRIYGGHYTAFVADLDDEHPAARWVELDDGMALNVQSKKDVVTSAAYFLFYRKRKQLSGS